MEIYYKFKHFLKITSFALIKGITLRIFKYEMYQWSLEEIRHNLFRGATGVLHVGGSIGQEAKLYSEYNLSVVWIESVKDVFEKLENHLSKFPNQVALNALVGNEEKLVDFHLASNNYMSSSIFLLNDKVSANKNLKLVGKTCMRMETLYSLREKVDFSKLSHWVLDVQGAELEVLKGAGEILEVCNTLEIECSDYNVYLGAPLKEEIFDFLSSKGFVNLINPPLRFHGNVLFTRAHRVRSSF